MKYPPPPPESKQKTMRSLCFPWFQFPLSHIASSTVNKQQNSRIKAVNTKRSAGGALLPRRPDGSLASHLCFPSSSLNIASLWGRNLHSPLMKSLDGPVIDLGPLSTQPALLPERPCAGALVLCPLALRMFWLS